MGTGLEYPEHLLLIGLSVITLLGILFLRVHWFPSSQVSSGHTPGKFELTVLLTQIMFPFLPMVALAAVLMGILNSHGTFFLPALAPALFNIGSLVVALGLYFWLPGWGYDPVLEWRSARCVVVHCSC